MGFKPTAGKLLLFSVLLGTCSGFLQENCTNYQQQFERIFSVPGDTVMLTSTLVTPDVSNYSISWYHSQTGQELTNQSGKTLVLGETLWFLRIRLDDDGEYTVILRSPQGCYRQSIRLIVEQPLSGECGRPQKVGQILTKGVSDKLSCPLKVYISKLNSYNVSSTLRWYKGCKPILDSDGKYMTDKTILRIKGVDSKDNHTYTCTLTFNLGGVAASVSETIDAWVREEYSMVPQVREPTNTTVTAHVGSSLSQQCRVFVPCIGIPFVDIIWFAGNDYILATEASDRVYTTTQPLRFQEGPHRGVWFEVVLTFTEVKETDFFINYKCQAQSSRGHPQAYFTLLPADPDLLLPIGTVFGCVTILFMVSVSVYYLFKVDIALWVRKTFPVLYTNTVSDGKLYDAYVAYAQPRTIGFSEDVETFALQTLPQVLEKSCGYKLFIAGRDCLPGEAIVDSVEENIQASRRLLLLYTASTFTTCKTSSSSSNNNHLSKNNNSQEDVETKMADVSDEDGDGRQRLECVVAMHRSLLEGTLKVVLVELEEIHPDQLALFPESVRHLRKKQGALCWWKQQRRTRQRWRTCGTSSEDEEKGERASQALEPPSPSLSPSSRFWKEVRYRMPVRGKRAVYPEKTTLLNL